MLSHLKLLPVAPFDVLIAENMTGFAANGRFIQ
jgi:hypothetical protein